MFFFGMDIPLVELLVAMGIIIIIVLFEAIILLYSILHHRRDIKILRKEVNEIHRLISGKREQ